MLNTVKARQQLEQFFIEDIGDGDITSESIFSPLQHGEAIFVAKADGVVAGLPLVKEGFALLDASVQVHFLKEDGALVSKGEAIAIVKGPVLSILKGERVLLNLIQRLSGIATLTHDAVCRVSHTLTRICDTRKTTPGLRMLEKYAVRVGGGYNHRFGLYDAVMIKDNHIAFAGGIPEAVKAVREKVGHMVRIEVECETEKQVIAAVEARADVIMLDNRSPDEIRSLLEWIPSHIITEASGGITLDNLSAYAETGVDYISLGMLTHSATALDISLNVRLADGAMK